MKGNGKWQYRPARLSADLPERTQNRQIVGRQRSKWKHPEMHISWTCIQWAFFRGNGETQGHRTIQRAVRPLFHVAPFIVNTSATTRSTAGTPAPGRNASANA